MLSSLGILAAALVIIPTVVAVAVTGQSSPSSVVRLPAAPAPTPAPAPHSPGSLSPVAAAQTEVDAAIKTFALSLDPEQRAQLLTRIRQLAATPGVHVPYR